MSRFDLTCSIYISCYMQSCTQRLESISGIHQGRFDALFMCTVPTVVDDLIINILVAFPSKRLIEIPTRFRRAYDIIPSLNNYYRKMLDLVGFFNKLSIPEPTTVHKEMAFNSGECQRPRWKYESRLLVRARLWTYHLGSSPFLIYSGSTISLLVAFSHVLHALALERY